jgi:hypothetical protein
MNFIYIHFITIFVIGISIVFEINVSYNIANTEIAEK